MNVISRSLALLVGIVLLGSVACQKDIPRSERFVPSEEGVLTEEAGATLLVEKFTGQRCVNCPTGAKLLHQQEELYPNRMIVVAHHASSSRLTLPELESEASDLYAKDLVGSKPSLPGVMLSRRSVFDDKLYSIARGQWAGYIRQSLYVPRSYLIKLQNSVLEDKIQVQVEVESIENKERKLMLQLWVVEDVWAKQDGPGGGDNYHHQNVMRGCLNGDWGEVIALPYKASLRYEIPRSVLTPAQAKVVAFVYDPTTKTKEILEAAIAPLISVGE